MHQVTMGLDGIGGAWKNLFSLILDSNL